MKQYRFIIFILILYIILLSYLPSTNGPTTTAETKSGWRGRQYYAEKEIIDYNKNIAAPVLEHLLNGIPSSDRNEFIRSPWLLHIRYIDMHRLRQWVLSSGGGEFENRVNFCRVWPLTYQNPYRIIVYSVANYRPHLSHFWWYGNKHLTAILLIIFKSLLTRNFLYLKVPKIFDPNIWTLLKTHYSF